jgi:DNA repair exonuclease SbcCD nuclease subunit
MLHTSDIHVCGDDASMDALRAVVSTANESEVDIVLIAGDLFDNARLGDEVVKETVAELGKLARPVVVIPGNHDCVDEGSIYRRVNLSDAGDHVFFVGNPAGEELNFEDLSLGVWARGIESHHPANHPLDGYKPTDPAHWSVVLTHGHYVPDGEQSDRSSTIKQEEIARLQCHYVALGHWHGFLDVSQPGVNAFYSGSPTEPGSAGASVNIVTLHPETGVRVDRQEIRSSR